jgi:hypothetical protein
MAIPEGFTDDMTGSIRPGRTAEELVAEVMEWLLARRDLDALVRVLEQDFGLSEEDALLALDRVQGGIVRALTGTRENEPDRAKDPLAWGSFTKVWAELPRRGLLSSRKMAAGRWNDWYESRKP